MGPSLWVTPTVPWCQPIPLPWSPPGLPTLLPEVLSTLWLPCPTPTSTTDLLPTPTVPSCLLSPLSLCKPGKHTSLPSQPVPKRDTARKSELLMCEFCSNLNLSLNKDHPQ